MISGALARRWLPAGVVAACLGAALPGAGPAGGAVLARQPAPPAPASPPSMSPDGPGEAPLDRPPSPEAPPAKGPDKLGEAPLDRPIETPAEKTATADFLEAPYQKSEPFGVPDGLPSGFSGRSSVAPTVFQVDGNFIPVEDRWRVGFPRWDRYGKGFPRLDDYPYDEGNVLNPYKQSVLKGDYPILGQNTFLELTGFASVIVNPRDIPSQTTPFESTQNPNQTQFFGKPNQLVNVETVFLNIDLFHGDAGFKQPDWRFVLQPTFVASNLNTSELAQVNPNVNYGTVRERTYFNPLQLYFFEAKIADLSPDFDFISVRAGNQPFVSDFRGFIFNDVNRSVRLFGTLESNRDQFNLIYFDQLEKDTNTQLNTVWTNRSQQIFIANFYRQDFIWPGYTVEASVHYNHDAPSFKFDKNGFLVRPDPVGVFQPHEIDAVYLGWAGDGHIGRFNINHEFYWVVGHDSKNPIANTAQDINAQMAAVELSYDRDYVRFRSSFFFASGDGNPNNHHATGFDSILDNPNFAGSTFSYFFRNPLPLFGVNLKQIQSFEPDLRSSKIQGQSNFVNPGLEVFNLGFDVDVTPKVKWINNCNFLWFDKTAVLETYLFQGKIDRFIGVDLSTGVEYRPFLSNNVVMLFGLGVLLPGKGFDDLYDNLNQTANPLLSGFAQFAFTF
jgi:hypothetical protein